MERRNKSRLDLQLLCRVDAGTIVSQPVQTLTQNVSRNGMLIRWLDSVTLPTEGHHLTVDVELLASADGSRRRMQFQTTVIRIVRGPSGPPSVGLKVEDVRFLEPATIPLDLAHLPTPTPRVI